MWVNTKLRLIELYTGLYTCTMLLSVVWISFSQVSGSVFEDLVESRSNLNVSNIAKVSFKVNISDRQMNVN